MKLLIDEDVHGAIVRRLVSDGHEVTFVRDLMCGAPDARVLSEAIQSELIVTQDKGFGELVFAQGRDSRGVLLIRLEGTSGMRRATMVSQAIAGRGTEMLGNFSVLDHAGIRIHRL